MNGHVHTEGRRGRLIFRVLPLAFLLLAFAVYALRNAYIKAYSDPMAWLAAARDFPANLRTSNLPLGFPAFLWLAMKLVGPYYVFLANLPVILLLVLLVAAMTRVAARETETPAAAALLGVMAAGLFVHFDPDMLQYMVNPYRDPLSYVLLAASFTLFAGSLQPGRARRVGLAASGLLLGFAYCTREPSLVALVPMFLLGVMSRRKNPDLPFWSSVAWFGVFLLIGCLPLLIQTLVFRQQVSLSPYAASHGRLMPGFYVAVFGDNSARGLQYVQARLGWTQDVLLLAGLLAAVWRRNRTMLGLALMSVVYFALYSFYATGVKRYFFVVALGMAPLMAYGLFALAEGLLRAARRPRAAPAVFGALTVALSLFVGGRLLAAGGSTKEFRVPQAKQFVQTMEKTVPAGSVVFSDRQLCHVIRTLTGVDSYELEKLIAKASSDLARVRDQIEALRSDGRAVFFMKTVPPNDTDNDENLLRRWYELEPAAAFPSAEYRLGRINHGNSASLYRIVPWSKIETSHTLEIPARAMLQIDVHALWHIPERQTARLLLNDQVIDSRVEDGASYYEVGPASAAALVLRSNRPVPADLSPVLRPLNSRLDLNFGEYSKKPHDRLLSKDFFRAPAEDFYSRRLKGRGLVSLPMPWRRPMTVFAELVLKSAVEEKDSSIPITVSWDSRAASSRKLEADSRYHGVMVPLAHDGSARFMRVEVSTGAGDAGKAVDLDRIYLYPAPAGESWTLDVGSEDDTPFVASGFYRRDEAPGGAHARWTGHRAAVTLFLKRPFTDLLLEIAYFDGRPAAAPAPSATLSFNDQPLNPGEQADASDPNRCILRAVLPARAVNEGENTLEIRCRTWKPANYPGSRDSRDLGIMIDEIRVRPTERK